MGDGLTQRGTQVTFCLKEIQVTAKRGVNDKVIAGLIEETGRHLYIVAAVVVISS